MKTITVILRDCHRDYPDPLIYTIEVADPQDFDEVQEAIERERKKDLGPGVDFEVEPLFAFAGDISAVADWRE
jgi:hypothetical protein